ncbi:hypothetical protein RF11_07365 [Thelohanellus kitauei]|uniref:Uncharacterized protein n=1 Tax=Thelohanellus kitauei TaxID=669202 RepID=A0A0C2M8J0_THEKT|nr:hypothetical protein RF11_07365 [Thelohanellus kitauei]
MLSKVGKFTSSHTLSKKLLQQSLKLDRIELYNFFKCQDFNTSDWSYNMLTMLMECRNSLILSALLSVAFMKRGRGVGKKIHNTRTITRQLDSPTNTNLSTFYIGFSIELNLFKSQQRQ